MIATDTHGNRYAQEGCDRCSCGCKYWENDRCVDCNKLLRLPVELEALLRGAADVRKRATWADDKARGRKPLDTNGGSPAYWRREAERLDNLAIREEQRFADALAKHRQITDNPDPF